jgi:hypothetical protein
VYRVKLNWEQVKQNEEIHAKNQTSTLSFAEVLYIKADGKMWLLNHSINYQTQ